MTYKITRTSEDYEKTKDALTEALKSLKSIESQGWAFDTELKVISVYGTREVDVTEIFESIIEEGMREDMGVTKVTFDSPDTLAIHFLTNPDFKDIQELIEESTDYEDLKVNIVNFLYTAPEELRDSFISLHNKGIITVSESTELS